MFGLDEGVLCPGAHKAKIKVSAQVNISSGKDSDSKLISLLGESNSLQL